PFFVGDRISVCRWYLGVTTPPSVVEKRIGKVALLKGTTAAFAADEAMLKRTFGERVVTLDGRRKVRAKLFKTKDFDLIHFAGHCKVDAQGQGGLELADGSFLSLTEIGKLESERHFAAARPFVMLNACASAQPYIGVTNRDSFAHRFVISQACA